MMSSDDFDVARIVPSMRDLPAGLSMRRRSLALIAALGGDDGDASLGDVARLEETVRGYSTAATGPELRLLARATKDLPVLATAPCRSALDCQRNRYFGADGVCIDPSQGTHWEELLGVARSMRMMPLVLVPSVAEAAGLAASEARAFVLHGGIEHVLAASTLFQKAAVLVVDWSTATPDAADLRALSGHVDAVLVSAACHRDEAFEALVAELDA